MKGLLFTIGIGFILSVAGMGQDKDKGNANIILDSGATIEGQLQSTLDVQRAKPGDRVVLKTTKAIKENGQTVVPKGAKLIGRVTEVEKRSKANNGSRLGLLFDRLESGTLSSDIDATIISVTNVAAAGRVNDADLFGSSNASARGSGSASAGGGLLGGTGSPAGGLLGGVTNTVGSTVNSGVQTVGSVAGSAGATVKSSTGSLVRTVNGIQISNSVGGSAQSGTTLAVPGRDLKLEKGTAMQLQLSSEVRRQ